MFLEERQMKWITICLHPMNHKMQINLSTLFVTTGLDVSDAGINKPKNSFFIKIQNQTKSFIVEELSRDSNFPFQLPIMGSI